jgi:nitrilase
MGGLCGKPSCSSIRLSGKGNALKPVRAAVVQNSAVVFNREATLEKTARLVKDAKLQGAELVLFPEAFISAYPKGLNFGAVIGDRTQQGREDFRRYFNSAIEVPGPTTNFLAQVAGDNAVYLVIGVIERDGGTLYCTVLFFSALGKFIGKHRKLMPTASERLVWGFGDGSTMPVFDTPLGKLGSVICWENYMPLLRTAMYAKGVQLYCAPTADDRDTWLATMQHIALEGRCFVLSACQFLLRGDCPDDYDVAQGNDGDTVLMRGGSCIINPLGKVLAGPVFNQSQILIADLDMNEIARGKYDFDVTGHYSRPDIFQLRVNEQTMASVIFDSNSALTKN